MTLGGSSRRWHPQRTLPSVVGVLLGLGGLAFVAQRLRSDVDAISAGLSTASIGWMAIGIATAVGAMLGIAVAWRSVLAEFGIDRPRSDVVARYFAGEIGKYVPGGVWPVIGRAELIVRTGAPRAAAYGSVAFSLGCLYLAAASIVLVAMALQVGVYAWWVVLVAVGGVGLLHPRSFRFGMTVLRRATGADDSGSPVPGWQSSIGLVLRYTPAWGLVAASTTCIAVALGGSADPARVMAAAVLSWIVGFIVAPVPGGVGVREAAFVAACGLSPGTAAATALLARAVFVGVDASGAVLAGAWLGRRRSADRTLNPVSEQ